MTTTISLPSTALNELRNRANALATAQHVGVVDGYSWLEAYEELCELGENDMPVRFTPCGMFEASGNDALFASVDTESDAIFEELKSAYLMGTQAATVAA